MTPTTPPTTDPLLEVRDLKMHFPVRKGLFGATAGWVKAVDGVSLRIGYGETVGLVGESGCGKTTLGRCVLRLLQPTSGAIRFAGQDLLTRSHRQMRALRKDMQIIFQDPYSSLNPRKTVLDIVGEALVVHKIIKRREVEENVIALMEKVGLAPDWINRYPHEFSGGQRQRIGIARAIALNPRLIVCDEAVSALDVSIQAQVINLLIQLRTEEDRVDRKTGQTIKNPPRSYLFIAHNLAVVKHISDRIAVMYLGKIVETAPAKRLFSDALHPYTLALLSAVPVPDPAAPRQETRIFLEGDVPSPLNPPPGCPFHPRCPAVMDICRRVMPGETDLGDGHSVWCHLADAAAPEMAIATARRIVHEKAHGAALSPTLAGPLPSAAGPTPPSAPTPPMTPSRAGDDPAVTLALERKQRVQATLLRRSGSHRLRTLATALAAAIVLAALIVGPVALRRHRRASLARRQMDGLATQMEAYRAIFGDWPQRLNDLDWRLRLVFPTGRAIDPWGTPWRFDPPEGDSAAGRLSSAGPDGQWDSPDDLVSKVGSD